MRNFLTIITLTIFCVTMELKAHEEVAYVQLDQRETPFQLKPSNNVVYAPAPAPVVNAPSVELTQKATKLEKEANPGFFMRLINKLFSGKA